MQELLIILKHLFCPVVVIVLLYTRVFMVAVSQAHAMRSHVASVTLSGTVSAKQIQVKAARTLSIVGIVFLTCLCAYFCSSLVSQETLFSVTSVPVENWLFHFNSFLNPLIYVFCYPWFLKSIKLILTLNFFKVTAIRSTYYEVYRYRDDILFSLYRILNQILQNYLS